MDDGKRAAKAFVDQYFPVKEPNSKPADIFGDLFSSPNSKKESPKKQGHGGQSFSAHIPITDGKYQGNPNKSQNTSQKGSNSTEHCEISEPCLMSSSVDYGCRDNYPYNPDNRYPGPSYYVEKKDRKDGSDYSSPEIAGAEWWQGSFYY
ncbi:uncharacterized protein LOC109843815 [Asparagus officinalis]|uniref:uncharacterized protein LOC109843815 n=1 Tax=Asparagus officinalis TaxID=4686 RepID=UPI00098E8039|nr:uncharacterized protein LOC109843815 [Asparagus officinalis]XP_020268368.1 uncharacterized protein LOC109843815 [Asparagus officinalis]